MIPIQPTSEEVALYEIRKKIYPRAVHGWFASWRWTLVVRSRRSSSTACRGSRGTAARRCCSTSRARKFYIFGLRALAAGLHLPRRAADLSALSLFLFTAVAGRLWCGYACPQTVYTEIFMWIERKIEGDRIARMRLDAAPLSLRQVRRKARSTPRGSPSRCGPASPSSATSRRSASSASRHHAGSSGRGNVLDPVLRLRDLRQRRLHARAGVQVHVPVRALPERDVRPRHADHHATTRRAASRAARAARRVDPQAQGLGDCVDCNICVQVCPTGIDIRKGLQYECIGCAACIDGCDQVMDKMGYPRGLIRYATQNALAQGLTPRRCGGACSVRARCSTGRTAGDHGCRRGIARACATRSRSTSFAIAARSPARRYRGIENVYRLQMMNTEERARSYTISAAGLPGLALVGVEQPIELKAESTKLFAAAAAGAARASRRAAPAAGPHKIELTVQAVDDDKVVRHEQSTFIIPR